MLYSSQSSLVTGSKFIPERPFRRMDGAPSNQLRMVQLNAVPTEHIWDSILH